MSDPVTNIEIEDVLSSIRRLVAETERPHDRTPDRASPVPERLVLSAALRVADPVLRLSEPEPQVEAPPPPAARAAVIEAALAGAAEEWEPDGSEAQPVMDWSAPAADDPPVQPVRSGAAPALLTDPPPEPAAGDDAELGLSDDIDQALGTALADRIAAMAGGLDEATLRALVVEVVRDELQGALGERITRNVRKLVRREIFRVLSSQEFD